MDSEFGKTESNLSSTPVPKVGRPARVGVPPVTWSIRGVEPETRRFIEKAANRVGKNLGQFFNEDVRAFAQSQLTQSQLPVSSKDIQDQLEQLTKIVEGIANRLPEQSEKTFWQRLFS